MESGGECVSEFKRNRLEVEAQRNWDRFYKRNSDAFFKDRHWTRNEFEGIFSDVDLSGDITFLEAGCGVGNLLFPLAEYYPNWALYGVDFSKNAIDLLVRRATEQGVKVAATVCDVTNRESVDTVEEQFPPADIVSLIFVLSSISPEKHAAVLRNVRRLIRPGGSVLFRDYAFNDHTMNRFGRGSKISRRFYKRIDGTRAYFFTKEELERLFEGEGFVCSQLTYLNKKTINRKEGIDVDRIFIQGRFIVPAASVAVDEKETRNWE